MISNKNPGITLEQRIQLLPDDIIRYIIPYTYSVQPKRLQTDICSFYSTHQQNKKLYYQYWLMEMDEFTESNDAEWWSDDIYAYINQNQIPVVGNLEQQWYSIFSRNPMLNTRRKIDHFYNKIRIYETFTTQIRICWGLLLPVERNEFVSFLSNALLIS